MNHINIINVIKK